MPEYTIDRKRWNLNQVLFAVIFTYSTTYAKNIFSRINNLDYYKSVIENYL